MQGLFRRRRLPHWDVPEGTYFVTACLEGSISALGMSELHRYRDELDARPQPQGQTSDEWEVTKQKLLFARLDEWLDGRPVVRHFDDPVLANEVRQSIYHFAGSRYAVLAWCIMPSHLHWVFRPLPAWCDSLVASGEKRTPREVILHSLKSFTATVCNRLRNDHGKFWQAESYDHWIRDESELYRVMAYIEQNPVKAGLVSAAEHWQFSSAFDRAQWGLTRDELLKPPNP